MIIAKFLHLRLNELPTTPSARHWNFSNDVLLKLVNQPTKRWERQDNKVRSHLTAINASLVLSFVSSWSPMLM